jgi:hypothetical protein
LRADFDLQKNAIGSDAFRVDLMYQTFDQMTLARGAMATSLNRAVSDFERTALIFLEAGSPPMRRNRIELPADDLVIWLGLIGVR